MHPKILVLYILALGCTVCEFKNKIGAIFYNNNEELKKSFELSSKKFNFIPSIKEINRGDILDITEKICALTDEGVIGIIDGTGGRSSEHIQSLTDMMELPHVVIQHLDLYTKNWSLLNLYPSDTAYNTVLEQLITAKDWNNFTILYVKGYSLRRVSNLFKMGNDTDRPTVTVRELSGDDYRDVLTNAKDSGYTNFVVDCASRNLEQFLRHAQQVGLMSDDHSYIFLSPDLFTLDLSRYRFGGVNMTGFRIVNLNNNVALWNFTTAYNLETGLNLEAEQLKTEVLLIHDAVQIFAEALKKVTVKAKALNCDKFDTWGYGMSLLNFMRTNQIKGITNWLIFDGLGERTDVNFEILEVTPSGNQTIAVWEKTNVVMRRAFVPSPVIGEENIMSNKTFKILISTTPPYGYVKESVDKLDGNDRYEGFTVDLITRIAEMLQFNYVFELENDYGEYDEIEKKWSGMVLKLIEEKADFAICDFTITVQRQKGIDFSMPFMTLGIGILYKEPSKQPPAMFSFMEVFSKEVWYYMVLVQLGLGVIMIFVGRISHKEWQNPVPCIEQPENLTNQFSFANSVWLIIGAVLQQGSEIAPIAIAPRMITSVWWFFTMVMVASYTGTLVAFLTVEKGVLPFTNVDELYNQKSISYGAKRKGSTIQFFETSPHDIHQKIYTKMKEQGWLVEKNDHGVELAENSTYAFFMESTSIEYYKERHCDLLLVGDLLDSKSYGIGMKKGSEYKKYIDAALLKLKENGEIQKLKDTWWKEKRGGGKCEEEHNEEPKQLDMKNMIGAFVVLGVGCLIGIVISTLAMLWGVFKRSVKYKSTFKEELIEELKFVIKFSGNVKPVRRRSKISGSADALAELEERDELRSLPSIRSGNSASTRCTNESRHSSKHSSRSLSVAFAKRREYY